MMQHKQRRRAQALNYQASLLRLPLGVRHLVERLLQPRRLLRIRLGSSSGALTLPPHTSSYTTSSGAKPCGLILKILRPWSFGMALSPGLSLP